MATSNAPCAGCSAPIPSGASFCPRCATPVPGTSSAPTRSGLTGGGPSLKPGTVVDGKYEVFELLGSGGFGDVFRVRHRTLGTEMALKTLHAHLVANDKIRERFFREARLLIDLNHPSIVSTHDAGEWQGSLYMVMDFCRGKTLQEILKDRGALPGREAVALLVPVLAALEFAHQRGIVHRDLKPANLIVQKAKDGAPAVKVLDFGIAKVVADADGVDLDGPSLTAVGTAVGTLSYMSPEQAQGLKIDGRSDLYAIGVILFQMLTARRPFEGENQSQVYKKILVDPVPTFAAVKARVDPPELEAIVMRALQKEPEHRFDSAGEMIAELQRVAGSAGASGARAPTSSASRSGAAAAGPRRSLVPLVAMLAVVLAAIAGYLAVRPGASTISTEARVDPGPQGQGAGTTPANRQEVGVANAPPIDVAESNTPKDPTPPGDPTVAKRFTLDHCPDFPLKADSVWRYRNGPNTWTTRVVRRETNGGETCAVVEGSGSAWAGTLTYHYAVREDGVYLRALNGVALDSPALTMKLPLTVGDSWTVSQPGFDGVMVKIRYTVKGTEPITVPAGTFTAFVLELQYPDLPAGTPGLTYWYARDVGAVKDTLGNELTDYPRNPR